MSGHPIIARAIRDWGRALAAAEAGCTAALAPSARRAALVIGNCLVLGDKTRRVLDEAVESSQRLSAEARTSAAFARRLDARAKFHHLLDRLQRRPSPPASAGPPGRGRGLTGARA